MTEELNNKLSHLPWLWQWREANEQALRIIKSKRSTNDEVQMLVDEHFYIGKFTTKELEDEVTNLIIKKQGISLHDNGKYTEQELF